VSRKLKEKGAHGALTDPIFGTVRGNETANFGPLSASPSPTARFPPGARIFVSRVTHLPTLIRVPWHLPEVSFHQTLYRQYYWKLVGVKIEVLIAAAIKLSFPA
jgi:hypothetical protein